MTDPHADEPADEDDTPLMAFTRAAYDAGYQRAHHDEQLLKFGAPDGSDPEPPTFEEWWAEHAPDEQLLFAWEDYMDGDPDAGWPARPVEVIDPRGYL